MLSRVKIAIARIKSGAPLGSAAWRTPDNICSGVHAVSPQPALYLTKKRLGARMGAQPLNFSGISLLIVGQS